MNARHLVAAALFAALAVVLPAGPTADQSPQQPTFRSGVTFVQIDATVTDAQGRRVEGLTKDDFDVYDNGRRQTITAFSVVGGPAPASGTAAPLAGLPEPDRDVRPARRLVVIVLDDIHTFEFYTDRLRQIASAVVNGLDPDDSVAFALTGSTEPGRRTIRTVREARGDLLAEIAQVKGRSSCLGPRELGAGILDPMMTMAHICESLRPVAHLRKAIVWIGNAVSQPMRDPFDGIYVDGTDPSRPAFRTSWPTRLIQAAWRSDVAVYGLDPRFADDWERQQLGCGDLRLHRERVRSALWSTDTVPSLTGGLTVIDVPDFDQAISAVLQDIRSYYLLGFTPGDLKANGRFRRLEVRARRPGLEVRARRGYWAPSRAKTAPAALD